MDTSRRIACYLGTVHWLIASSGLFLVGGYLSTDCGMLSLLMAISALKVEYALKFSG
jgi:hypothetical protein